jgi:uncharacterized protein (DUF58 family)
VSPAPKRGVWARLRALLRPPRRLTVTRTGRTYLVLTFGVGFGALNTGNNLLYLVLGLMLSMIIVSGVLSERALRHLRIRRLGADAAYAGEPFAFRWAVSRPVGASFALTLSEEDAPVAGTGRLAYLAPGEEQVVRAHLQVDKRGPLKLSGVKVTTSFPLGLFAKSRVFPLEGELLVYPRRGFVCSDPKDAQVGPLGDAGDPRRGGGNGDLLGLRELQQGEDARRVHWKKSAAAGKLLRTEREREERKTYVLHLPGQQPDEALDRRCEEVAALAQRLLSDGHEVGLETETTRLRPATGAGQHKRILRALAYAGYEAPAPAAYEEPAA